MEEKGLEVDKDVLKRISDRVRESMSQDLMEWREKLYAEVKDDVKEHLSALRDSDNALNLRMIEVGDSVETLSTRIEKLTAEEGAPPEEEKEKVAVEAKTELEPPEEEGLEDILVVCDHGGKGQRTGFTKKDKAAGVAFCPQCARRITYA